jgi:hypothetical protein
MSDAMKNQHLSLLLSFFVVALLLLPYNTLRAQVFELSGTVSDAKTGESLAFVNILVNDGTYGGTTDIDGKFHIKSKEAIQSLKFSFIGYQRYEHRQLSPSAQLHILMQPIDIELAEVVVKPGINPAHRIIDSVLFYRDQNHPERMRSFAYTAYDKMVLTIDTLMGVTKKSDTAVADSGQKARDFLNKRDLFLMETVTERKFLAPDRSHEKVLATKISGFQDPIFIFLISQTQNSNFYDETIQIVDKNYINPISKGSKRKYLFILEESTVVNLTDSIFSISFRPLLNTNFDGMQGVLTIHSDGWAIQNVTAEPYRKESGFSIRIQQMYQKINGERWFPVQLNTDLLFKGAVIDDGQKQYPMVGIGKSYFRDIELNPELVKRQFSNIAIEVEPDATDKDAFYWLQHRIDSLNERTIETYRYMDSLGQANNFDRIAGSLETMMTGRIPYKFIDLKIDKFMRYNDYEGLYLGIGMQTNKKFSKMLQFGGFWGYGFGDKTAKYGLDMQLQIDRYKAISLETGYSFQAFETGGFTDFEENVFTLNQAYYRNFFINRMDLATTFNAGINFRALRHFKWKASIELQEKSSGNGYAYLEAGKAPEHIFNFTKIQLQTRFSFKEKFMQTPRSMISLGSDFPTIWLAYTQSFDKLFGGNYNYTKWEFKSSYSCFTPYFGKTNMVLIGGMVDGNAPGTELFNTSGTYRSFGLYAPESFGTMRTNEFLSDRFAALYLTHSFGKLLFRKGKFEPELLLATNIAFGQLSHSEQHGGITFNTLEHGYYESGLVLNNLLSLPALKFGLGTYYRFGPYSFDEIHKNFGWKFSLIFGIDGF